ncbi:T-complex protein 1 subunit eta [Papilio machaon]|uniref:CCT-eta n=1 Tax=Papilio machaon TaxID=76193 RepID=A0A0N1PHZ3_PAPMA|nr:T-complex protein 1 subunit eta [Papilio machaon]
MGVTVSLAQPRHSLGSPDIQPQILVLKEGTDQSQGKPQLISNINACQLVVDAVRTTLGPRGMDKLIVDHNGKAVISNDGATIMKLLDIVHPAAKTLVDIAKSQDAEGKKIKINPPAPHSSDCTWNYFHLTLVFCIKKVSGGALEDSFLVSGVAFKKTFSYAGFEMQPKSYDDCKIALLNIELELKAERDNAQIRLDNVKEYQKVVDAEWQILYEKLAALHASGANVVLSMLPIGDVATQYFADRDMFCAGRVPAEDLRRTQRACGGAVLSSVRDMKPDSLGRCQQFTEKQVGGERYNIFTGCPAAKACTIVLRGGAEQFLEETERSLHDAIMIVRRTIKNDAVVAGGGAIDMEISKHLREYSKGVAGKEQLLVAAAARAFEAIPRQLADNAGLDATGLLNKLRQRHHAGDVWYGIDIQKEDIADNYVNCVWEPAVVKINAITAACEAATQILSVDETIKNVKSEAPPQMPGRGMGRPMMG